MNQELWKELEQFALNCKACELCKTRRNVVFGSGDPNSRLWLVGEAPGSNEDEQGLPFVGQAGAILDTFLEKNGFKRHSLFITNVIKCRPPNNADPTEDQKSNCFPILAAQLAIGKPKYILHWEGMLPRHLFQNLLGVLRKLGVKLFCQVKLKLW